MLKNVSRGLDELILHELLEPNSGDSEKFRL